MPLSWIMIVIVWILIVVSVWIYIRKHRPEWIGLGDDFNKQKMDGLKYGICPNCSKGTLEPRFRWWQYCIGISLPPGIMYIAGNPSSLICSKCDFATEHIEKRKLFTRISLAQKLSKEFFIAILVDIAIVLIVFGIWFSI